MVGHAPDRHNAGLAIKGIIVALIDWKDRCRFLPKPRRASYGARGSLSVLEASVFGDLANQLYRSGRVRSMYR
jgi:hypothetical protein